MSDAAVPNVIASSVQRKTREKKIQRATHTGVLRIGELDLSCAVLADGTRVLTQEGFLLAIGRSGTVKGGKAAKPDQVAPFLNLENLKRFVSKELEEAAKPIAFRVPSGKLAWGYRAELLPQVCEVYLKARDAFALRMSQRKFAVACDILMRALATVGIVALIDEATGYQANRDKDALATILEEFVAKELRKWIRTFPDAFYTEMFRLRKFTGSIDKIKKPAYYGHLTNDLIYRRLAPGVLEELRELNPVEEETGRRKHCHHQWLSGTKGHPKLLQHLAAVITLMKSHDDWKPFYAAMERALPKYPKIKAAE